MIISGATLCVLPVAQLLFSLRCGSLFAAGCVFFQTEVVQLHKGGTSEVLLVFSTSGEPVQADGKLFVFRVCKAPGKILAAKCAADAIFNFLFVSKYFRPVGVCVLPLDAAVWYRVQTSKRDEGGLCDSWE